MKTAVRKILCLIAAAVLFCCPLAARPADPDSIELLKKRVAVAEKIRDKVKALHEVGSRFGRYSVYTDAHIRLAEAQNQLYRASGEKAKRLTALEDKLKWTQEKHKAVKAAWDKAGPGDNSSSEEEVWFADLAVSEAEYELKQAKKESEEKETETAEKETSPQQEQILQKLKSLQGQIDILRNEVQRIRK